MTAALAAAVFRSAPLGAAVPHRTPLEEQSIALAEQDLAICLDKEGREEEAVTHYRAALGHDPLLKAPWANLAAQAFESGSSAQAVHLASMALFLDPYYETARAILDQASKAQPSEEARRQEGERPCPEEGPAGPEAPGTQVLGVSPRQACQERRAGLLASLGGGIARGPIEELARIELDADHPATAALLAIAAVSVGGSASDSETSKILPRALEECRDPCGSTFPQLRAESRGPRCEAIRSKRADVERGLGPDLRVLDEPHRAAARLRVESLLASGLDVAGAARRWRMEQARGDRPLADLGGLVLRLGEEWLPASAGDASGCTIWRRRPGDAAFVVCALDGRGADAEALLQARLRARHAAKLAWTVETAAWTEPGTLRSARLSAETEDGARVEGLIWLAESPRARGVALVVMGFPGTGGLGSEGVEQSREEVREAMRGAVLVPERWGTSASLGPQSDLPMPIYGIRNESDERRQPWRTFPAGDYSVALPPGMIAARYAQAPRTSAPPRPSAALWFRGRFKDRDGVEVVVGDASHAASVDILDMRELGKSTNEDEPVGSASKARGTHPVADPGASPIAVIDMTSVFASLTGADQATLSRYKSSSGGFEWLVARLAFEMRLVEIAIPVFEGGESIALYWIASTVRPAGGTQPDAPVDLSSSLGIAFFRPPPEEKGEAFYKEGDLRSRDFTMLVARGYAVAMNAEAVDAFPVKITRPQGDARIRLDRWDEDDEAAPMEPGASSAHPPGAPSSGSPPALARARLAAEIRDWLEREGFKLTSVPPATPMARPARAGALWGVESQFVAEAAAPARDPTSTGKPSEPQRTPGIQDPTHRDRPVQVQGAGTLLQAKDGRTYIFLSLRMGTEARQREEEIRLMLSSLRLTGKRKS